MWLIFVLVFAIGSVAWALRVHQHPIGLIDCSEAFRPLLEGIEANNTKCQQLARESRDCLGMADSLTRDIDIWHGEITGQFVTFREQAAAMRQDIEKAKDWCKQHKPRCGGW
jgi:hypothetical protein